MISVDGRDEIVEEYSEAHCVEFRHQAEKLACDRRP